MQDIMNIFTDDLKKLNRTSVSYKPDIDFIIQNTFILKISQTVKEVVDVLFEVLSFAMKEKYYIPMVNNIKKSNTGQSVTSKILTLVASIKKKEIKVIKDKLTNMTKFIQLNHKEAENIATELKDFESKLTGENVDVFSSYDRIVKIFETKKENIKDKNLEKLLDLLIFYVKDVSGYSSVLGKLKHIIIIVPKR